DAEHVWGAIAKHRLGDAGKKARALTLERKQALAGAVKVESAATQGEIARATLLLIAKDPDLPADRRDELGALVTHPPAKAMAAETLALIAVGTVALAVLQSYIKIEYDKKHGWRVTVEKEPMDKSLLGKVVGWLSGL